MSDEKRLEINTEIANELVEPILKIIDEYFFVKFENCKGEVTNMLPWPEKVENLKEAASRLESRASEMGAMSIILTAYGKDGLREEQKAKEIADICNAIVNLAECRVKQVVAANDYLRTQEAGKELFESLGI